MTCPYYRRSPSSRCGAVAGAAAAPTRKVVERFCRDGFSCCPAFRYTRAAGRLVHPGDFAAWVRRGLDPGQLDPAPQQG